MQFIRFVRAALLLSVASLTAGALHAQPFPSRPIRILVGFAPGGATDLIARLYAQQLKDALNTPIIVENKAGASELMAIRTLMSSPADGYTLWLAAGSSLTMGPAVRKDLPYEPAKDFTQIGLVATAPGVFFVHPSVPVRTLAELIAYAKENPGKLNYGSAGVGSSSHLQMEYMLKAAGVSMTHIPYKAANESVQAVAGGSVHPSQARGTWFGMLLHVLPMPRLAFGHPLDGGSQALIASRFLLGLGHPLDVLPFVTRRERLKGGQSLLVLLQIGRAHV